jgi:hypothetical protein
MYPHERSLVKRLEGQPFVLLGINADSNREELKKVLEKERITWRSWWNDGKRDGRIARRWNVRAWPTFYILDANGVIRYKNVEGRASKELEASLDQMIDALLKEMANHSSKEP